jgi:hypothetical protein
MLPMFSAVAGIRMARVAFARAGHPAVQGENVKCASVSAYEDRGLLRQN